MKIFIWLRSIIFILFLNFIHTCDRKIKKLGWELLRKRNLEEKCELGDRRKNRRRKKVLCMLDTLRIYFFQPRPTQCPGRNFIKFPSYDIVQYRGTRPVRASWHSQLSSNLCWCDNRYSFRYRLLICTIYAINLT